MRIKHSKYKNTGLIFELLVKQIASDTLSKQNSPAVGIIKKFFTGRTSLVKEFKLYQLVLKSKNISQSKAEAILSTITEISKKLNQPLLKSQKYKLIAEIKKHYNLSELFAIQVRDYKPLAALYCLMESQKVLEKVDPTFLVTNKTTILEHLTTSTKKEKNSENKLVEEYSKYDKDLRLLTFKILLEKFNNKYINLLPEQKTVLREFITSVNSTTRLKNIINKEFIKISEEASKLKSKVKNKIVYIKLEEVLKKVRPLSNTEKIEDKHLIDLMQYYDLLNELRSI